MGPKAEKLVKPLTENCPFEEVVKHFDNHFIPKVNVIHERAKFHLCIQQQGENIETYVRKLYDLAEYANFDNKEETIRDRFVVGLLDKELSEKLQLCSQLTLKEAITQARQFEQVRSQLSEQRQTVDAVT